MAAVVLALCPLSAAVAELPVGPAPPPIEAAHFPDPFHALVWRNWRLVAPARIAEVVGAEVEEIEQVAASMGLPPADNIEPEMRRRGYITLIRRNWHLLPYEQLLQLLDMSEQELEFILREEDFLFIKLGNLKPRCEPVIYRPPTPEVTRRAAEIKQVVEEHFGELRADGEPRFAFVEELSRSFNGEAVVPSQAARGDDHPRFLYSYFGAFGDPLLDAELDPYPEGLLARLNAHGVNGVWLHVVLRQLAPGGEHFPEFGAGHETRLANLRHLVERAKRHGISVYLYMNEPRARPADFFTSRPDLAGAREGDYVAMCTSRPEVRSWMADALAHVFREVPDLGGVFTITASENFTSCASHGRQQQCPHCRTRSYAEIIAEVNATVAEGVHRSAPDARVLFWDWGWNGHGDASDLIPLLPQNAYLMSVSEWGKPISRGGVASAVGEYSISAVGPGPRATRHWAVAGEHGMRRLAKVQVNITNELLSVPFLPVMDLVAEHAENLARANVDGLMLSWSFGGYPSLNLRVTAERLQRPDTPRQEVLGKLASLRYGEAARPHVLAAWSAFSDAYREYPFHISVLYNGPQHMGPANPLFLDPTGYRATMVGLPYDDLDGWRGPYPPEVLAAQFSKVAAGWQAGLAHLRKAAAVKPRGHRAEAEADYHVAAAAHAHFASAANQARFVVLRDRWRGSPSDKTILEELQTILDEEIRLAKDLHELAVADSRLGFEAANHYYYVPLDLVEKVIQCESIRRRL